MGDEERYTEDEAKAIRREARQAHAVSAGSPSRERVEDTSHGASVSLDYPIVIPYDANDHGHEHGVSCFEIDQLITHILVPSPLGPFTAHSSFDATICTSSDSICIYI